MATVKGPLMSVSASGTYSNIVFSATGDKTIAGGTRQKLPGRTPAQQAQAEKFKTATEGWSTLDEPTKDLWKAAAEGTGNNGYQLYLSEYMGQFIIPPGQPIIP